MSTYFLSMDAHFCECTDGVIFLNVKTQRYQGLAKADFERLRAVVSEWPVTANADRQACPDLESVTEMADSLVELGILTRHRIHSRRPIPVAKDATESIQVLGLLDPVPQIRVQDVLNLIWSWAWARTRLWKSSIATLTGDVRKRRARLTRTTAAFSQVELRRVLTIFARLRPWLYTAQNKCLLDSLVLLTFLSRYGIGANWVFGVIPKPFQAHCWVQYEDLVLNDSHEHMELYTPILKT